MREEEETSEEVMPSKTTARQTSMLLAKKGQPRRAAVESANQVKNDCSPTKNNSEDNYPSKTYSVSLFRLNNYRLEGNSWRIGWSRHTIPL